MRDLVYYVATSLDGYIASLDSDFSAFPQNPATLRALFERYPETFPTQARAAFGAAPPRRFDTVLMGYRTYRPALDMGLPGGVYPHLEQIVATHRDLDAAAGLSTISGDVAGAVRRLKAASGRDIWLCGGAHLAAQLVNEIDEIQVKVNPILFGIGLPLLPASDGPRHFALVSSQDLPGGVIVHTYRAGRG